MVSGKSFPQVSTGESTGSTKLTRIIVLGSPEWPHGQAVGEAIISALARIDVPISETILSTWAVRTGACYQAARLYTKLRLPVELQQVGPRFVTGDAACALFFSTGDTFGLEFLRGIPTRLYSVQDLI